MDHLLKGMLPSLDEELTGTWQGFLQTLAHQVRVVATEHPQAFSLVATRHPAAAWLRPPCAGWTSSSTSSPPCTVMASPTSRPSRPTRRSAPSCLVTSCSKRRSRAPRRGPVEEPLDEGDADISSKDADLDLTQMPTVTRLRPPLSQDRSTQEFEIALETLLDRLEMSLSQ